MNLARRFKDKIRDKSPAVPKESLSAGSNTEEAGAPSAPDGSRDDSDALGLKVWYDPTAAEKKPALDIVFVHGLTGKRTKTWLADGAENPWPQTLLPEDLPEARVITYGYDADVVNFVKPAGQNTVRDHANNLNSDLTNLRRRASSLTRPLVFVAHSLGGLVCRQACILSNETLETEQKIFQSLIGLMFLGTPHAGASLAKFALAFGNVVKLSLIKLPNNSNLAILKRDSEVLAGIQDSFGTLLRRRALPDGKALAIYCCVEEKPVSGLGERVVDPDSAKLSGYPFCTIHADHMSMTRFDHASDVGYERISGKLREWVDTVRENSGEAQAKPPGHFLLDFARDEDFVGREDVLTAIDDKFAKSRTLRRVALAGLGGIGKTQIAIEYAYRERDRAPGTSTFWVNASSPTRFAQSYDDIARLAKIPGLENSKSDTLRGVARWLSDSENGQFLLIVDNADDKEQFFGSDLDRAKSESTEPQLLAQYLPHSRNVAILFTSRDKAASFDLTGGQELTIIDVDVMGEADTLALLTKLPKNAGNDQIRRKLIAELDHIPLAITQAVAFILQSLHRTIKAYLQQLRASDENELSLLSENMQDHRRYIGLPNSVCRALNVTLKHVQNRHPAATFLLSYLSLLDRQSISRCYLLNPFINHIMKPLEKSGKLTEWILSLRPKETVTSTDEISMNGELTAPSSILDSPINTLLKYSLIKQRQDGTFSMHRLVQSATRSWSRECDKEEKSQHAVVSSLFIAYDSFSDPALQPVLESLDPHVQQIVTWELASNDDRRLLAWVLQKSSEYCIERGDHVEAERRVLRAIDITSGLCDMHDMEMCAHLVLLAAIYDAQGRVQEALKILNGLKVRMTPSMNAKTAGLLAGQIDLTSTHASGGRIDERETLLRSMIQARERLGPPENPLVVTALMESLAFTLYEKHHLPEAEQLLLQVIDRHQTHGANHLDVLQSQHVLGSTNLLLGNWSEAEKRLKFVWKEREKALGPNHLHTLKAALSIAVLYTCQGHKNEAIELLTHIVENLPTYVSSDDPLRLSTIKVLQGLQGTGTSNDGGIDTLTKFDEMLIE